MTFPFTNPNALWLLGLIPLIIFIHSWKPRPRQETITTLFLLEEALGEKGSGFSIKKILLKNIPMLLQCAIVLLAAAALADPVWTVREDKPVDTVVIIDTSASMKTLTTESTRFSKARDKAVSMVDSLSPESRMLIIESRRSAVVRLPFSSNKKHLKKAIREIKPQDTAGNLEEALYLALPFVQAEKKDRIVIITDDAGNQLSRISGKYPFIEPVVITGGKDNVGITRFEFRQERMAPDRYQIFMVIKNFNTAPVHCPIRLLVDKTVIANTTVILDAGEEKPFVFSYRGLIAGTARASIDRKDDLAVDNRAWTVMSASGEIWVLLVSDGHYYLEQILSAYPNVKVNRIDRIIPSSWNELTRVNDIVIVDRRNFPATNYGNLIMINSFSPSIPIRSHGKISPARVTDWNRRHPLTQQLDFGGLTIKKAEKVAAAPGVTPLVKASGDGLMFACEKEHLKAVFLGFDPADSDLPLRVAFPVLMGNMISWLYPDALQSSSSQIRSGETLSIHMDARTENFRLRRPSGKWEQHGVTRNPFLYPNTGETGLYMIIENKKRRYFAVNLLHEAESDILSTADVTESNQERPPRASAERKVRKTFWYLLFAIAAAVLGVEWYAWLRTLRVRAKINSQIFSVQSPEQQGVKIK